MKIAAKLLRCCFIALGLWPQLCTGYEQCSTVGLLPHFVKAQEISVRIFHYDSTDTRIMPFQFLEAADQINQTLGYRVVQVMEYDTEEIRNSIAHRLIEWYGQSIDETLSCEVGIKADFLNEICILQKSEIDELYRAQGTRSAPAKAAGVAIHHPIREDDEALTIFFWDHFLDEEHYSSIRNVDILINADTLTHIDQRYTFPAAELRMYVESKVSKDELDKFEVLSDVWAVESDMQWGVVNALIRHELLHAVGFDHFPTGIMTKVVSMPTIPVMDIAQYIRSRQREFRFSIAAQQLKNWQCWMRKKNFVDSKGEIIKEGSP